MILNFDGSITKNPGGTAKYGWTIKSDELKVLKTGMGIAGTGEGMTSNVAEYCGLLAALEWLISSDIFNPKEKLVIRGDSALVCNVISKKWGWETKRGVKTGLWKPHEKYLKLKTLVFKILEILKENDIKYEVEWVPREQNTDADYFSKIATK